MTKADTDSLNPVICLVVSVQQPLEDIRHEELAEIKVNMTSVMTDEYQVTPRSRRNLTWGKTPGTSTEVSSSFGTMRKCPGWVYQVLVHSWMIRRASSMNPAGQ